MLFKLSYLNLNFALTLGYLNPALNNPALMSTLAYLKEEEVYKDAKKNQANVQLPSQFKLGQQGIFFIWPKREFFSCRAKGNPERVLPM